MPVLVTGAEHALARATARALAAARGEVRVYLPAAIGESPDPEPVRDPVADRYRQLGCKVARGRLDDEGRLELALEQVHTVVHVDGGPLQPPEQVLDGVASVVSAAIGAGCRRIVWPSMLGAGESKGAYLAACADAEALLGEAPVETVVVRRSVTYAAHDPLTAALAAGVPPEVGRARHAPVYVDDLAAALAGTDRARGARGASHVVVTVTGPEVVSLDAFARLLRGVGSGASPLPAPTAELLARDAVPGDEAIGREGTAPAEGAALLRAGYG